MPTPTFSARIRAWKYGSRYMRRAAITAARRPASRLKK
jgi:hypothetical protein